METRLCGKCDVICYALFSAKDLLNKWWYKNIQYLSLKYVPCTAFTRSPFVPYRPQRAQYGRRTSFGIRMGFIES